jgi:hypothetical protein
MLCPIAPGRVRLGRGTLEKVIKATKAKIKRRFHRMVAVIAARFQSINTVV